MNAQGEIVGCGPEWACARFGQPGHNYHDCPICWDAYEEHIRQVGAQGAA